MVKKNPTGMNNSSAKGMCRVERWQILPKENALAANPQPNIILKTESTRKEQRHTTVAGQKEINWSADSFLCGCKRKPECIASECHIIFRPKPSKHNFRRGRKNSAAGVLALVSLNKFLRRPTGTFSSHYETIPAIKLPTFDKRINAPERPAASLAAWPSPASAG